MKIFLYFQRLYRKLLDTCDDPAVVARGVAIGVFFGFTPFFGLKTLLAIFFAWVTRSSTVAAVIAVALHDVVAPFWPIILRVQYDIGYWLLSSPHHFPPRIELHHFHLSGFFHGSAEYMRVLPPLVLGSMVIAIPAGLLFYFAMYVLLRKRREKKP